MKNKVVYRKVKCKNCGHSWDYHGKSKWYLACPKCKNTININELIEKDRIRWDNFMSIGWFCKSCNFQFDSPMVDTKTNEQHCPYCGSNQIKKR